MFYRTRISQHSGLDAAQYHPITAGEYVPYLSREKKEGSAK